MNAELITKAVVQHFNDNRGEFPLYIESGPDFRNETDRWLELRASVPEINKVTKNQSRATIEVDVLISVPAEEDIYLMPRSVDLVYAMFTCIEVLDGYTFLGNLTLMDDGLHTFNYGRMEDVSRLNASVFGTYEISF